MVITDLLKNIEKVRRYRGCILILSMSTLERNSGVVKEILTLSRIAGRKLYILINGRPGQWASKLRDYFSENIDVSIYLYEFRNLNELISELMNICSKDKLIFVSSEYAEKIVSGKDLSCGEIFIV